MKDGFHGPQRRGRAGVQFDRGAVKAGLRNARAKGKRLGRPSKVLDVSTVAASADKGQAGVLSRLS
jgi:hypothetical protein